MTQSTKALVHSGFASIPGEGEVRVAVAFESHPTGHEITDAWIAGFLHGIARQPWDDMHDYAALCGIEYENARVMAADTATEDALRAEDWFHDSDMGAR